MRMEQDLLTPANVQPADTASLLRARARELLAKYERMCSCHESYSTHSFNFTSPEKDGSDAEWIKALRQTNQACEHRLEAMFASMERDPAAIRHWIRADKRAVERNRMWEGRDDTEWRELDRRNHDNNARTCEMFYSR